MSFILFILIFISNCNFVFLVGFNPFLSGIVLLLSLFYLLIRPSCLDYTVIRLPSAVLFSFLLLFSLVISQDILMHTSFSYSLKLIQVVSLIPAVLIIFSELTSSARNFFAFLSLVFFSLITSLFRIVYIGSSSSGCLFCLDNYTYGMRTMPGLNLSGNACLSLLLLGSVLLDYFVCNRNFCPSPNISRFLFLIYISSALFSFYIPSRQLLLSSILFLIIMHYDRVIFLLKQSFNGFVRLRFKLSHLAFLLVLLFVSLFLSVVFSSEFFAVLFQRSSEVFDQATSFIRFQQLFVGLNLASDSLLYGQDSQTILYELSTVGTSVFENSFLDLTVKYGLLCMTTIFFILYVLIYSVRKSKKSYLLKVIASLLVCSFFNEILLETPFWIPIFFAYFLDLRLIFYDKSL